MLSIRLIPTMLYRDGTLVKGKRFDSSRRVCGAVEAMRIYNMRWVDELIFLDVHTDEPKIELISDLTEECFIPFAAGGGVRTIDHFRNLLRVGADKVVINTAAVETPELITRASEMFGCQCVVVSIDYKDGEVFTHSGQHPTGIPVVEWCQEVEYRGAGEIILTSIEHEGMMGGYDIETLKGVKVKIPVVVGGGAGSGQDLCAAINAGADAVSVGSLFHFTEVTPLELKMYMANRGHHMRLPPEVEVMG